MAENPWEFVKEDDGVKRYKRDVEGSKFSSYKGVTIVDANMAQVAAVLRDIPAYPKWMANISDSKVLRTYNPDDMDIYFALDFPWPASDRDMTVQSRTKADPDTGTIIIHTETYVDPEVPEKKKYIRIPQMVQIFTMSYVDKDKTEVSYSLHLESGGKLPAMAVEMDLKKAPFKSLKNMREIVKEDKYWKATPLDEINLPTTRIVLTLNLGKYIKDEELIQMLFENKPVLKQLIANGHSDEGKRKNAPVIVRAYVTSDLFQQRIQKSEYADVFAHLATNEDLVNALLKEEAFINLILEVGRIGMTDKLRTDIVAMIKDKLSV